MERRYKKRQSDIYLDIDKYYGLLLMVPINTISTKLQSSTTIEAWAHVKQKFILRQRYCFAILSKHKRHLICRIVFQVNPHTQALTYTLKRNNILSILHTV